MKIEQAKEFLPLVEALVSGKTIQYSRDGSSNWIDLLDEADFFLYSPVHYRIKPEPREVFIPCWPDGFEGASYDSEEEARKAVSVDTKCKIIRYREVIE